MPASYSDENYRIPKWEPLPEVASKDEQGILPVASKNTPIMHAQAPSAYDSDDEIATKEAAKDFLNGLPSATETPNLPVQYNNPVANKLFQLYFQGIIDSDTKQGFKRSQLYQSPRNGKVIFCRDTRDYNKNEAIDPCYAYARYGIGLYISQHIIYQAYGIENTDFIAENTQQFYDQFIVAIKNYERQLSESLTKEQKKEVLSLYAREYLSDIAHSIALQLTDQFGTAHKEFKNAAASLESLDSIVISASMACEQIPYVTIEESSYNHVENGIKKETKKTYLGIVHPKSGKMTDEIKELYENFNRPDSIKAKKPLSLSETEGDKDVENDPVLEKKGRGDHNFFDDLKPCKRRVAYYFKTAILDGKVSLCSQDRSNFAGAKKIRVFSTEKVVIDNDGKIQLENIGTITGNSTALTAFKGISDSALIDYDRMALLQLHKTMAKDEDEERGLHLCVISLCSIDIKTTFDNRFRDKREQIDPLDAKIARITDAAARETDGKVSFNNLTINYERLAILIKGDGLTSRWAQNAVTALTHYENLPKMLDYVYRVVGIVENIAYMQEFVGNHKLSPADRYRFEQYLELMGKTLAAGNSGNPVNSRDAFLDIVAVFAMLCDVHNELVVKYDDAKEFNIIKPLVNCASGKNRTGAAIHHYMVLSRTADFIGVQNIPKLLSKKYHPLRLAIGDEMARIDMIGKSHEDTLGASGLRKKSRGGIGSNDVTSTICDEYMFTEHSTYFKSLIKKGYSDEGEYLYIDNKDRIDILNNQKLQEIALNPEMDISAKKIAYKKIIDAFSIYSIQYTLRILRAPNALQWLPTEDAALIKEMLIERMGGLVPKSTGFIQSNLGDLDVASLSVQPDLHVEVEPEIQHTPKPRLQPKSVENVEPMIQNSSPSFFSSIGNRLGSSPSSQAESKLPSEQRRKETDLKKGSIIGGIFIALVSIVTFIELHSGISIFAAISLAGTAMTGWFYAREDESDKKKNSSYKESSSCSFFGAVPIEVNDQGTGKHNSPTIPRMKIP